MENKPNVPTPPPPPEARPLDAPLRVLDLPGLLAEVRQEAAYLTGDRNTRALFKSDDLRLVLLALHAGAELATHTAPGSISVQVLEGELTFRTAEQAQQLTPGLVLTLQAGIPHSVVAVTESAFLLTLAAKK